MSDKDFLLKTKFCYKGDAYLLETKRSPHERMARQGKEGIKFWGRLAGYYAEK